MGFLRNALLVDGDGERDYDRQAWIRYKGNKGSRHSDSTMNPMFGGPGFPGEPGMNPMGAMGGSGGPGYFQFGDKFLDDPQYQAKWAAQDPQGFQQAVMNMSTGDPYSQ